MWLITFTLKKLIWIIIYIFMIKFVFNFKGIYKYACVTCFFKNNLTNYLYFYNKNDRK